jgi:lipoate-protein ligase A
MQHSGIIPIFEKVFPMLCLASQHNDPYYNLAAEEYLLRHRSEDFFLVWISKPAIIVGKHQNTLAEINHSFVHNNQILVARRLSGGGTVYNDHGNINFAFITNEEPGKLIDFRRYASPVIEFLEPMGIKPVMGDKNDIMVDGFKISGNAMHVFKNRVLHHGTLLFNADLENLRNALAFDTGRYSSRAVQSNRASVINIRGALKQYLTTGEFVALLLEYVRHRYQGERYVPDPEEIQKIEELALKKYSKWEWIYGYSPEYRFENRFIIQNHQVKVTFAGVKGLISDFNIQTGLLSAKKCGTIARAINGCRHQYGDISRIMNGLEVQIPFELQSDNFVYNLF